MRFRLKMSTFRFKQFEVRHEAASMKVGTDGVLLGAWADVAGCSAALDIGCGTGLIALMLAQRGIGRIDAVEIDAEAAAEARRNVEASPWSGRIYVHTLAVQNFTLAVPADLIVSNPPFYDASLLPPDAGRAVARHTLTLSFDDLVHAARRSAHAATRFCVVLPAESVASFRLAAAAYWFPVRQLDVRTTPRRGVRRSLLEFSAADPGHGLIRDELILQDADGDPSAEYRALTKDFYLKF